MKKQENFDVTCVKTQVRSSLGRQGADPLVSPIHTVSRIAGCSTSEPSWNNSPTVAAVLYNWSLN